MKYLENWWNILNVLEISLNILKFANRSLSDSEDEMDGNDQEYPSLDSVPSDNSSGGGGGGGGGNSSVPTFSPNTSEPPSITESMLLMNDILSDRDMDRHVKIDKLEAILSAVSTMDESVSVSKILKKNKFLKNNKLKFCRFFPMNC